MQVLCVLKRFTVALTLSFAAAFSFACAQDVHLSQMFSNPLYLNPAFAGTTECGRVSVAYRNQWPNIGGGFSLASASYDQYIKILHGGIGAYINADFQGGGTYRDITAAFMYSFRARLSDKLFLTLAVEGSYANKYINWTSLTFADQYDPYLGLVQGRPTGESGVDGPMSRHFGDVGVGACFYGEYFYVGLSVAHLVRPDIGFMGKYRMPIRYSAQAGGKIYFKNTYEERRSERDIYLSPNIVYMQQGKFTELDYGLYAHVWPVIFGVWFRQSFNNPDALIFLFGFDYKAVRISYSYDLTVSKLTAASGGSHEISLGFRLPCSRGKDGNKYREVAPIPCPRF